MQIGDTHTQTTTKQTHIGYYDIKQMTIKSKTMTETDEIIILRERERLWTCYVNGQSVCLGLITVTHEHTSTHDMWEIDLRKRDKHM
jgi:hypothetical protein